MNLAELGLTPTQHAELETHDPNLIEAWLNEIPTTARSPAGWFLAGIRTGRLPGEATEADRARAVRLAETWIRNAGHHEPTEESLLAALFDHGARLHPWHNDQQLRQRMTNLWRTTQQGGHPQHATPTPTADKDRKSVV